MTDEPQPMGDWERLGHYVFGMMNGSIQNEPGSIARAWEEYRRLGGDPSADPWPVVTLVASAPEALLARARELRGAFAEYMGEHGVTVDVSRADKALAALLGERLAEEAEKMERAAETAPAGDTCARCEVMDGVLQALTERDGRPYCERCGTDGSGGAL